MKEWTCGYCGKTEMSQWVAPPGWLNLREPGDILVCGDDCASTLITAIRAKESADWAAGKV